MLAWDEILEYRVIAYIHFLGETLHFNLYPEENRKKSMANIKPLRKCLILCAKTVVDPRYNFRFHIISNITPQIRDLFGDFIRRYEDKTLKLRW